MADHLPDPAWAGATEICPKCKFALSGLPAPVTCPECGWMDNGFCLKCGYSLAGIVAPAPCPECGDPHTARQFIMYGVPKGLGEKADLRGVFVAGTVIVIAIFFQLLPLFGQWFGWYSVLATGIVMILGIIAFVRTGAGTRGGKCRFVFTSGGVAEMQLAIREGEESHHTYTSWIGDEVITFKKISNFWYHLTATSTSKTTVTFTAGVRCPHTRIDEVFAILQQLVLEKGLSTPPTISPLLTPGSKTQAPPLAHQPPAAPPQAPA